MTSRLSHPKYRSDIDGLRALAVLPVVAFHAFPEWIKGGFTGVDVFFVISGYLISTIIFENLDKGTFRFFEFYSRRVRRISPALLLVLLTCYAAGWFTLLADEYKQLGKHMAGGAGFIANFMLWSESGYFDNEAQTKPLLHLWSLGVEEQFYILYPFLVWFAWKMKWNVLGVTVLLGAISFCLSLSEIDAAAAFYFPQTRFWELMCGSALAWLSLYRKEAFPIRNRHVASCLGGMLLVYGFVSIDKEARFLGLWTVIPVVGSVLMIGAGKEAWINKYILSSRIAVWFGLISFPLYLWHWPLLSFPRIIQGELPSHSIRIAAIALSIFFAWLTYRFVERPVRAGRRGNIKTALLLFLMIMAGLTGYGTYVKDGLTFRKDAQFQDSLDGDIGHTAYHKYIAEKYYLCTPQEIANVAPKWDGYVRCMQSKPDDKIDIALIGDSHAEDLFLGMAQALPEKNIVFYINGEAPYLGNPDFKRICESTMKNKNIKTVIISNYWVYKYSYALEHGWVIEAELMKVVDMMLEAGKNVYLTDDVPDFPFSPCKGKRRFGSGTICTMPYTSYQSQTDVYFHVLDTIMKSRPSVRLLHIGKYFCDGKNCSMAQDHTVLYRDKNHLNINGSSMVGRRLVEDNRELFR